MSAIFFDGDEQRRLAKATKAEAARRLGEEVHTEIAAAGTFTLAEDYHQKYSLRRVGDLLGELRAAYPRDEELIASTAAARINGFLAGCGDLDLLRQEIGDYGLSPAGERKLLKLAESRQRGRR